MIQKMMQKHRKFMNGNAGFSLVELIIVIAIMAALVAILAPQYIKYVEKSRKTGDENTISEMVSAIKVAAVDENYTMKAGTVKLTKDDAPLLSADGIPSAALTEYFGDYSGAKLKSTEYAGGVTITVAAGANGGWNVTWAKIGT